MSIPNTFIQDLIARADVAEVIGRHVQLKKGGANLLGLCPFHSEKSPSFTVSPSKQFYHCFGCGKSGNAIGFLMDFLGLNFVEAVEDLAQQLGMQVPREERSPQEQLRAAQIKAQQNSLTALLEKAASAYQAQLKTAPKAIGYLEKRGLTGTIAHRFGLGYAPPGWRFLANVMPDYSMAALVECGLVIVPTDSEPKFDHTTPDPQAPSTAPPLASDKRYDRFRDRIMFPIRNTKGEVIGFGGRVFGDEKPKYLNSPETPVFHKGHELYGLYEAREAIREKSSILVTEGYMDVVALAQWGFANAVATLGTACTTEHARKLFRYTDRIIFAFDGDSAGQRAARRALESTLPFISDTRSAGFLFLPPEHDPDSFVRANGQEAFEALIQAAVPLSRFLLSCAAEQADLDTTEGRSLMASQAEPLWAALPDGAFKRQLLVEIAQKVGLSVATLNDLWATKAAAANARQHRQASEAPAPASSDTGHDDDLRNYAFSHQGVDTAGRQGIQQKSSWRKTPDGRWRKQAVVIQPPMRRRPISRQDNALRLILGNATLWDTLGHDEHDMLCALAHPHGAIFKWLDMQHNEQGPQSWSVLQLAMTEHEWASTIHQLMQDPAHFDTPENDVESELKDTLLRLELEQLGAQAQAIAPSAETDLGKRQQLTRITQRMGTIKAQLAAMVRT